MRRLIAYSLHYLRKIASLTGKSSRSFHSSRIKGSLISIGISDRSAQTRLPELSCHGCVHWWSKVFMDAEVMGDCQRDRPYEITYDHEICYDWEGYYHGDV